jgi:hypothetical protein
MPAPTVLDSGMEKDLGTPLMDEARRRRDKFDRLFRKALADPDDPLEGAGLTTFEIIDRWHERVFVEDGNPRRDYRPDRVN